MSEEKRKNRFVAGDEVDEMEYDFTQYVTGPAAEGSIPEPSSKQVAAFYKVIGQALRNQLGIILDEDGNEKDLTQGQMMAAVLGQLDDVQFSKIDKEMTAAVAKLCSGTPSETVLGKLPYRPKQQFFGWIYGQFLPNLSTGVTPGEREVPNNVRSITSSDAISATG